MDYQHIVQELTELIWEFDCKEAEGKLKIINQPTPYLGRIRRDGAWKTVGKIGYPAKIVEVYDNAPYLKSLENESFPSKPVLLNAVRRESFRHRAKEWFVAYLSAEIKQLTDEG